jgi:hypothetical protein
MENKTFTYSYSAERNKEVESIRNKYLIREESKLEKLKKLDYRVQSAGMIESLSLGIVGVLTFGVGMCFFLGVFSGGRMDNGALHDNRHDPDDPRLPGISKYINKN